MSINYSLILSLSMRFFKKFLSASSLKALFAFGHAARLTRKLENDAALALIEDYVELFPKRIELFCGIALEENPRNTRAYRLLAKALELQGRAHLLPELSIRARDAGLGFVYNNDPFHCAQFFKELIDVFPQMSRPYFKLYNGISSEISKIRNESLRKQRTLKPVIISIVIWGARYKELFLKYFLPSMLASGNIPELSKIRTVSFDVFASAEIAEEISSSHPIIKRLQNFCNFNVYSFDNEIVDNEQIKSDNVMRYMIYGGFHHVSIIRAKKNKADIICIAPDGIHSDGSFTNYVRFLDDGFKAVLFTSTRGQAEFITPILDNVRELNDQIIKLSARQIVDLSVNYIHHEFLQYLMVNENNFFPDRLNRWFFVEEDGFISRNFQLHPIAIASECLQQDITFSFTTVDDTLISRIVGNDGGWEDLKVITDSNEGVMLDLTFAFDSVPECKTRECTEEYLENQVRMQSRFNLWQFSHKIRYQGTHPVESFCVFELKEDKSLIPIFIPLTSALNISESKVSSWLEDGGFESQR